MYGYIDSASYTFGFPFLHSEFTALALGVAKWILDSDAHCAPRENTEERKRLSESDSGRDRESLI